MQQTPHMRQAHNVICSAQLFLMVSLSHLTRLKNATESHYVEVSVVTPVLQTCDSQEWNMAARSGWWLDQL